MKALSIRPQWAHAILHLGKDIENRSWSTTYRGPLLIHAGQTMTRADYADFVNILEGKRIVPPDRSEIRCGGIIGIVDLYGITEKRASPWFTGKVGWRLRNPKPLPFKPWKGRLGLFEVPGINVRN